MDVFYLQIHCNQAERLWHKRARLMAQKGNREEQLQHIENQLKWHLYALGSLPSIPDQKLGVIYISAHLIHPRQQEKGEILCKKWLEGDPQQRLSAQQALEFLNVNGLTAG